MNVISGSLFLIIPDLSLILYGAYLCDHVDVCASILFKYATSCLT